MTWLMNGNIIGYTCLKHMAVKELSFKATGKCTLLMTSSFTFYYTEFAGLGHKKSIP